MFRDPIASRIAGFLASIGLRVEPADLSCPTFLPGIAIRDGSILVDEPRLLYPGDLLHEAGHLAVLPPDERARSNGDFGDDGGMEMAAIAWSYAAAVFLNLDLDVLFHPDGYRGGARALIDNFSNGRGVGAPMLAWMGLTELSKDSAGAAVYPAMHHWLRA